MISLNRLYGSFAPLVALTFLGSCGRSTESKAIRLIELFETAKIEGAPAGKPAAPKALWDFANPPKDSKDPMLGWKAGDGVSGLQAVNGKLTGKATTDFPVIYAPLPQGVDASDAFDAVQVRIHLTAGSAISATNSGPKPDFQAVIGMGRGFTWPLVLGLTKDVDKQGMQTLTIPPKLVTRMGSGTLLIRPTNAPGASFEIESIRAVSQRERRAEVRSGVGWQGLADVYQETIVSRSPEKLSLTVDVPDNAWLDLNLGTPEDHAVTFHVADVQGNQEVPLLTRTVTTPQRWEPSPLDFKGLSGKRTLRFWVEAPVERAVGFWGGPVIRTHGGKPKPANPVAKALGNITAPQGVILIMVDTLRKDHVNFYGGKRETAPNLTKIAGQGALFMDNVSQATWTKVATPSIMTSLYPISHRVHDIPDRISAAADTLAEQFHNAGYATVSYSSVPFTGKLTNLQQGFEELHESTSLNDPKYESKSARAYVDRASNWIERHQDVPFFMYLHVFDPHDPFEPRAPYNTIWADPSKKEEHEKQLAKLRPLINDPLMKQFGMPTRSDFEKAGINGEEYLKLDLDWYDGSIRGMDVELARLFERLRQLGLEDKVQIAIIGDHGEEFLDHGSTFHGRTAYGEVANVMMMLYRPGVIPAGVQIKETTRSIDMMPTLLDLSGIPIPKRAQGQSLVPLLAAARDAKGPGGAVAQAAQALGWKPQPAVTEKAEVGGAPSWNGQGSYGIVSGGWKLIHNFKRHEGQPEYELYNHATDPLDKTDVAAQNATIVDRLKGQLAEWLKMVEAAKLPAGDSTEGISPADLNRLRSLGYVQ